ncbi:hypothetical protein DFJ77DRAFT_99899 [Powellomyces hirtus]|nr:hypothetical protein DFJ77DRAFT_99899 [Powellomyces hirtus]
MQTCVNKWHVSRTIDLTEPIVAFQWLQGTRQTALSQTGADQKPRFKRMQLQGPRTSTTGLGFVVVTQSGQIHAFHEDGMGELCQFSKALRDDQISSPGQGNILRADLKLMPESTISIAAVGSETRPTWLMTSQIDVDFVRKEIVFREYSSATLSQAFAESSTKLDDITISHFRIINASTVLAVSVIPRTDDMAIPSTDVKDQKVYGKPSVSILSLKSTENDGKWETAASFCPEDSGLVTAVDVVERSEWRGCDSDPVILLGYHNGTCELRDVRTLELTNLNLFTFSPYLATKTWPEGSDRHATPSVASIVETSGPTETNAGAVTGLLTLAQANTVKTEATSSDVPKGEDVAHEKPAATLTSSRKTSGNVPQQPILSFAVSPNTVEILVAKRDVSGATIVDLFRYDHDKLEASSVGIGREAIVRCLATKFALAIMNGHEYADLAFSSSQLATSILQSVYTEYDAICELSDDQTPSTGAPARWTDTPLLSLQLALHRSMPRNETLVFNTEAAIHILSIRDQCYAAFEHYHVAMARIESMVQAGNFQVLESNGLHSAMILRKDCLQHLVSLQIWFIKFSATLLRQLYCTFNMHRNTGRSSEGGGMWAVLSCLLTM